MITADVKALRFDHVKVRRAMDDSTRRVLMRQGAFMRKTAKRSMRQGRMRRVRGQQTQERVPSKPGEPPRVWRGQLKNLLYYSYNPATKSVVVGPKGFAGSEVPRLMELGGTARVTIKRRGRKRKVRADYPARPFMVPALHKLAQVTPDAWRGGAKPR